MTWGFVGLGQMGLPMAHRLAGVTDVVAYDRKGRDFEGLNCVENSSGLAGCNVLLTCLPNGAIVEDMLFGDAALAQALPDGAVVIDTSTTSHGTATRIGARLTDMGLAFLDAPVSGMQQRAEDGTLTMMVGGDAATLNAHHDTLASMASKILHVGPVGAGQLAKLINQLLFDINMAALAEILPISAKLGLDPDQVAAIVNSGTGRSYASEFFVPNILRGVFDRGYPMQAAYKDLIAGAEITAENACPAPVLAAATATYQLALANGFGAEDKGAMIKVFERLIGAEFRSKE
ncbi:NAD(P)-dependent oxidoreductase [Ruegeria sp. WL0004]|uniref:NAD(P)-dependent oxidoreductase n=1 Tax=Ruegeria marisflavi TaxID=2984152 RepID=A0ABT2WXG0_9RHOB|nr:NAD(P)-dependent oxidoreductase [Ruegeria sp. WL0004]MCU9840382.1 NAD(P)-dependent oxidoreductase [Ruegeria sp. WL0004]